ncbi:MAG: methylated-DNA--[protein]-cysteine S-methyltransferase [Planctomycetes bacterium]|nr:methylated-DNA--[protein]-cysteine S-methyltransferase [Planctomycetota bacterium]
MRQVKDFVAGKRDRLDLESIPQGSEFQQKVWKELRRVPYGATVSYGELARRIGRPSAVRATARANATNPVALVVPCHRVIGKDGAVTGYNGGVAVKEALLAMEAKRR